MEKVNLFLRKKVVLPNRLITAENFFLDGDNGSFDQNIDGITSDMAISQSGDFYLSFDKSLKVVMNEFPIVMENTTPIILKPNSEYFVSCYILDDFSGPPALQDFYIGFEKTGWTDGVFTRLTGWQWGPDTEEQWVQVIYKLVTGTNTIGALKLISSGLDRLSVDVQGEPLYIDVVSVSEFMPYIGDKIYFDEEVCLPVEQTIDSNLQYKLRELNKINFSLQNSKASSIAINSLAPVERYFGFSHDPGSVRGQYSWDAEYLGRIEIGGLDVMSGTFSLDELSTVRCKFKQYKGKLISDNKLWYNILKNYQLCDLDWQEYNHVGSFDNYEASLILNGDNALWVYGLMEYDAVPDVSGTDYTNVFDLYGPQLFTKPMIKKIYRFAGYQVEFLGAKLNSPEFRDLVAAGNQFKTLSFIERSTTFFGYYDGQETLDDGSGSQVPDYEDVEDDNLNWINGNCANKEAGFVMTIKVQIEEESALDAPSGGVVFVLPAISAQDGTNICTRAEYQTDFSLSTFPDHLYWVKVEIYNGFGVIATQYVFDSNEPAWSTDSHIINNINSISGGYQVDYTDGPSGDPSQYDFGFSLLFGNGAEDNTSVTLHRADTDDEVGYLMDINRYMFCNSVTDFLESIIKIRNIIVLTDDNLKKVTWIARNDLFQEGKIIDTRGLVTSLEETQTRLAKKAATSLEFKYTQDAQDEWYKENATEFFSDETIDNSGGNKVLDIERYANQVIFSPTFMYEPILDVWVPRVLGISNIRILQYEGVQPVTNPGQVILRHYLTAVTKTYTEYGRLMFVSPTGVSVTNLSFKDQNGNLGIANEYWRLDLDLLLNARLIKTYIRLNYSDVRNIDYRALWLYKDVVCILNQISQFDPFNPEQPALVELITTNQFFPE